MYAAALIASLPPLLVFVALGRYFIRGLLALGTGGKA
jgi:glucose/arabinose transport system permease protein